MTTEALKRKLTAIPSADVKGYSRLMGEDEEATVHTLTSYREIMSSLINQHRGRVVDSPGDNVLAEFASVVDAVQCAVEIQQVLKARNADLPDDRKMEFRIGINLGDVIVERDRIYGDGVNIAARIEELCEGGCICISGSAFEQIENKLPLRYESLGEHTVKNISKPVNVYKANIETLPAVSPVERKALELPDKPSVAVLPFANMSGDSEQEYFSDGMAEDLITDLSKISSLFVIARNSSFTYKGKNIKVQQVGEELGVRYVLEGSVRKAGNRVRITAQLVDTKTGYHLWAERYDRNLDDIFELQDEVTQKIVAALKVELTQGEQENLERTPTDNLEAYDYFLRGESFLWRTTKEANAQARQMFKRAVELDPEFALAYAHLGLTYWLDWGLLWSPDPDNLEQGFNLAQRALALDDGLSRGHIVLGISYLWKRQHEQAIAEARRAIQLNPNDADCYAWLGWILNFSGRPEESIELVKKALRLNPHDQFFYLFLLGEAYSIANRHEEAIGALKRVLARNPEWMPCHSWLSVLYGKSGRNDEARNEVTEILRTTPGVSLEVFRQRLPFKDQAVLERHLDGMRKAGLPE
jgi:adenylate cyclase